LYCDGTVWSLGSSLNHLGERGAVVVKLPAPEPVTARILEVWEQSTPLAAWLAADEGSEAS
jgi:hypothetical protein